MTGETRPLEPLEPGLVRIYSCGPTVYGPVHIGNFRSALYADVLVRHLRRRGLKVTWVMNITDIDDKIIKGAAAAGIGIDELADRWLERFLADAETLRMTRPDVLPRATDHIDDMVALITTLLERGHAYRTDDGSVFFRIASWPTYGRLARLDPDQMRVGERVETDEYGKDDIRDFALWKGPKAGEPSWDTAIGPGRPGWHIECSAMSMRHLGPSFDIHTGGIDLIFPHHEDELAQSEAATGLPFVRTWLHCAHLLSSGAKMAKSTGNIAKVDEVLASGYSAPVDLQVGPDGALYVLAWNAGAVAIFGDYSLLEGDARNILHGVFTDPHRRHLLVDWEQVARATLAAFRAESAKYTGDPDFERLIELMMRSSPEFREWWPQRDVVHRLSGMKHLRHPVVGAMTFEHMSLSIDDGSDMKLIVYTPLAEQNSVAKLRKLLDAQPVERRSA